VTTVLQSPYPSFPHKVMSTWFVCFFFFLITSPHSSRRLKCIVVAENSVLGIFYLDNVAVFLVRNQLKGQETP
jgi:hypothetical protein